MPFAARAPHSRAPPASPLLHLLLLLATALSLLSLAAALPAAAPAAVARTESTFPVEIPLVETATGQPVGRPVGIVADRDTRQIVATATGQLVAVDIRSGDVTVLNRGGDDQRFGGICIDSREDATIYATGRDTGVLYAFNRMGELVVRYQITKPQSRGGTGYLSGCIQTRYQLMIADSANNHTFYLPLPDKGPMRGRPPVPTEHTYQGVRVKYAGDWVQHPDGVLNAYGVEWTQKFNETVYIVNSHSGKLFALHADETRVNGTMQEVEVVGHRTKFPGALGVLYDSTNENVFYISQPTLNRIAVLEFSRDDPLKAKYIRMLSSTLTDGPIAIAEYGNWLYTISGRFTNPVTQPDDYYSLVQMPRHEQILSGPDEEFTTNLDDAAPEDAPVVTTQTSVVDSIKRPPPASGSNAPPQLSNPTYTATADPQQPPPTPSASADPNAPVVAPSTAPQPDNGMPPAQPTQVSTFSSAASNPTEPPVPGECFPAGATVTLRGGRVARMDELAVGDEVLVRRRRRHHHRQRGDASDGGGDDDDDDEYSPVFVFSHRDATVRAAFVRLETNGTSGASDSAPAAHLEVTAGHYVVADGRLRAAAAVGVGDKLTLADGRAATVVRRSTVWRTGLFNPQTVSGDLVVDGVRVSAYTTAVAPRAACALLSPLRALQSWRIGQMVLRRVSAALARGDPVGLWLPSGAP